MKIILDYPDFSLKDEKTKVLIDILKEWFEELTDKSVRNESPLRYCRGVKFVENLKNEN
jgi:predicted nuclease of restriction endonuclease-like RecB superfamily